MESGEGLDHVEAMHVDNGSVDSELGPTGFLVKQKQQSQCSESLLALQLLLSFDFGDILYFYATVFKLKKQKLCGSRVHCF